MYGVAAQGCPAVRKESPQRTEALFFVGCLTFSFGCAPIKPLQSLWGAVVCSPITIDKEKMSVRIAKPLLIIPLPIVMGFLLSVATSVVAQQAGYNVRRGIEVGRSGSLNENGVSRFNRRRNVQGSTLRSASPTRSSANPLAYKASGTNRARASTNSNLRIGQPLMGGAQPRRFSSSASKSSYSRAIVAAGGSNRVRSLGMGAISSTPGGYRPFGGKTRSRTRGSLLANRYRGLTGRVGLSRTQRRLTAKQGLAARRSSLVVRAGLTKRAGLSDLANR